VIHGIPNAMKYSFLQGELVVQVSKILNISCDLILNYSS
jgi:hypothetical protein